MSVLLVAAGRMYSIKILCPRFLYLFNLRQRLSSVPTGFLRMKFADLDAASPCVTLDKVNSLKRCDTNQETFGVEHYSKTLSNYKNDYRFSLFVQKKCSIYKFFQTQVKKFSNNPMSGCCGVLCQWNLTYTYRVSIFRMRAAALDVIEIFASIFNWKETCWVVVICNLIMQFEPLTARYQPDRTQQKEKREEVLQAFLALTNDGKWCHTKSCSTIQELIWNRFENIALSLGIYATRECL